jgi:hypothetical protein
MPVSSTTVLDQIARFFILLSNAPSSTNNGDPGGCDGRWRGKQGRSRERGKRAVVMTATKPIPSTKPVRRHGDEMTMACP